MSGEVLIDSKVYNSCFGERIYKFTLPSVSANTESDEFTLEIGDVAGEIVVVDVICASTDFDISIRQKTGVGAIATVSDDEVYKAETENLRCYETDVGAFFYNTDTTEIAQLYVVIKNDDLVNATGVITFNILYKRM